MDRVLWMFSYLKVVCCEYLCCCDFMVGSRRDLDGLFSRLVIKFCIDSGFSFVSIVNAFTNSTGQVKLNVELFNHRKRFENTIRYIIKHNQLRFYHIK